MGRATAGALEAVLLDELGADERPDDELDVLLDDELVAIPDDELKLICSDTRA